MRVPVKGIKRGSSNFNTARIEMVNSPTDQKILSGLEDNFAEEKPRYRTNLCRPIVLPNSIILVCAC